ncbi:S1C family serine protease [Nocardioides pocheonensis]|uniref:PDZ domain-containing protein n=1 Tax=Nocardioides pocheonensis TaxID=661485 RepID=A0A3N0GK18_9ACTN|nr:trypsin-like peptidase domain-containing protein [Nocardioides pocheonensis]RNM12400.1 PDZ domain-containing protein [Nocardioides pocheonensis]
MTDQNNPAHDSQNPPAGQSEGLEHGASSQGAASEAAAGSWSAESPTPAAPDFGHTRPLPPFQQPASETAAATARRPGGFTAAVLAGALLVGGAAGVGGAAAYDAVKGDDSTVTSSASGPVKASNAAVTPTGSVEKVAATVLPSVVKINVSGSSGSGSGSGIVLKDDGTILTNNHVVSLAADGGSITVNFNDGRTAKATVVGTDKVTDMAVIKAEGVSGLTPATIGKSSDLRVGQSVVAIGSPYGLNSTVTTGIVSALNRPVSVSTAEEQAPQFPGFGQQQQQGQADLSTTYPAIQTDAAINPGNSGGPLVDMSGRVVGVNSSIRTADGSTDSGGSIGLGFAIPIDEVLPIVNQIIDGQKPTHARLAVSVSDVQGNTLTQGAQLQTVDSGGAADKAGLQKGDVITKVDDDVIDGSESLVATIRGHRPGDQVTLTYLRDGKTQTTTATLGSDATTSAS